MAEEGKGIGLVILGVVAIIAVIGLVLLFSKGGASMTGAAASDTACQKLADAAAAFGCPGSGFPACSAIANAQEKAGCSICGQCLLTEADSDACTAAGGNFLIPDSSCPSSTGFPLGARCICG